METNQYHLNNMHTNRQISVKDYDSYILLFNQLIL